MFRSLVCAFLESLLGNYVTDVGTSSRDKALESIDDLTRNVAVPLFALTYNCEAWGSALVCMHGININIPAPANGFNSCIAFGFVSSLLQNSSHTLLKLLPACRRFSEYARNLKVMLTGEQHWKPLQMSCLNRLTPPEFAASPHRGQNWNRLFL